MKFRTDIQALRAIAVLAVVVNHIWPSRLPGGYAGVDVFFVISGFLITSHLLEHHPRTLMDLARFWARRIRRLLPAALTVLAVTLVASRLFAPETTWESTARMARAAALYVVNWLLAADAVDYFADTQPTPIQHFWSLSVEEQFYFIWPILLVLVSWISFAVVRGRREGGAVTRPLVVTAIGVVVVGSLIASILVTAAAPAQAYFVTYSRLWELGAGALLASLALKPPRRELVRTIIAWLGLAMIGVTFAFFTDFTPFPGFAALLPVLGTALVIYSRPVRGEGEPGTILALRPIQWIGDVSYSIYLWHWPVWLILPTALASLGLGSPSAGALDKAAVVVVAVGLAALTKYFIEDPGRRWRPQLKLRWVFGAAALGMAIVVTASTLQIADSQERAAQAIEDAEDLAGDTDPCFAAAALDTTVDCPPSTFSTLALTPAQTKADWPWIGLYPETDCISQPAPWDTLTPCSFGDVESDTTVALVGNSHAYQWFLPLQAISTERGWRMSTAFASGCVVGMSALRPANEVEGCRSWGDRVNDFLLDEHPDVIIVSNWQASYGGASGLLDDARAQLQLWVDAGIPVVVLRDTANFAEHPPDCIEAHPTDFAACNGKLDEDFFAEAAAEFSPDEVAVIDYSGLMCPDATACPAVIGNLIAYFDTNHMSGTFARSMQSRLDASLEGTGLMPASTPPR